MKIVPMGVVENEARPVGSGRPGRDVRSRLASATVAPLRPAQSGFSGRPAFSVLSGERPAPRPMQETSSDMGVVSRVLAGIDAVGSTPAEVSVYSQPMGRSIVTDVVVHQTDEGDGTRKIGNHWQGAAIPAPAPPVSDGIGAAGIRVGAYEESRNAAREAYMMFQGMKVNQTA